MKPALLRPLSFRHGPRINWDVFAGVIRHRPLPGSPSHMIKPVPASIRARVGNKLGTVFVELQVRIVTKRPPARRTSRSRAWRRICAFALVPNDQVIGALAGRGVSELSEAAESSRRRPRKWKHFAGAYNEGAPTGWPEWQEQIAKTARAGVGFSSGGATANGGNSRQRSS
jgi:hypothetical protein